MPDAVDLARFLERHRRLFVLTGADCSAPSGIPDYRDASPNAAHAALARLEAAGRVSRVVTQNVDGLHTRAAGDVTRSSPQRRTTLGG